MVLGLVALTLLALLAAGFAYWSRWYSKVAAAVFTVLLMLLAFVTSHRWLGDDSVSQPGSGTPTTTTSTSAVKQNPVVVPSRPPTSASSSMAPAGSTFIERRVYFATDRRPDSGTPGAFLNTASDSPGDLSLGWCVVTVPRKFHRPGNLERPRRFTIRARNRRQNPNLHFVITERHSADPEAFWDAFHTDVNESREKQALLFVHGYRTTFDDAVYRSAQLAIDLKFDGPAAIYSWPSNGSFLSYVADKERSLSTVASFKVFLRGLAEQSGATRIHVIAHSMGNNALVHALAELRAEATTLPGPRFANLVMAAPDIDRLEFRRHADAVRSATERLTLYAARKDRALDAAEELQHEPRLGDASPIFVLPGLDTIDASDIVKGFIGHGYFSDFRLLDDIERLIAGRATMPRFGLDGVPTVANATHWIFLRSK